MLTLGLSKLNLTVGDPNGINISVTTSSTTPALAIAALQAPASAGSAEWLALLGSLASASFNGITGLTLMLTNAGVEINTASGSYSTSPGTANAVALDWTAALDLNGDSVYGEALTPPTGDQLVVDNVPVNLTGPQIQASGTGTVNAFNFVSGTVNFVFEQQTVGLDANNDGTYSPQTVSSGTIRGPPTSPAQH